MVRMTVNLLAVAMLAILPTFLLGQTDPVQILLRASTGIRPCYNHDGTGNNVENPRWGAVEEELLRPEGNNYVDGDWAGLPHGPNARAISNILAHETCTESERTSEPCINDWFWLWGQMIDHDMVHVPTFPRNTDADVTIDVDAPENDPFLARRSFPMRRSAIGPNNEQVNLATAYLDSSQIYGASDRAARSVRAFQGGLLLATSDGFMPVLSSRLNLDHSAVPTFDELGHPAHKDQFLCADMRCNQHAPMAALQAMFVREHNRIASALAQARHPAYQTDEQIYQAARAMVIAMNQAITYNEFLPLLLGRFTPGAYRGYRTTTRASISNAFATAAFRIPHSMVGCTFKEMTQAGQTLRSVNFATAFFDSTWIRGLPAQPNRAGREQNAYQTIMHALALNPSPRMDHKVAPAMRSVLFSGVRGAGGVRRGDLAFDVITSDIQRGRDHGLLDYRRMRRALGWRDITRDTDITRDPTKLSVLRSIYTDLDSIDLFSGLMTEDALDGSLVGPVATSLIRDQFERLREGDRCWYENQFAGQLLTALRNTKLGDLVQRNFNGPTVRLFGDTVNVNAADAGLRTATTDAATGLGGGVGASTMAVSSGSSNSTGVLPAPAGLRGAMGEDLSQAVMDIHAAPATSPSDTTRRRETGRSRLDNGVGVREAGSLDDVIGYRCEGGDCRGVCFEDEEEDEEVLEWARQLKEERRIARMAAAMGGGDGVTPLGSDEAEESGSNSVSNALLTAMSVAADGRVVIVGGNDRNVGTMGMRAAVNGFPVELEDAAIVSNGAASAHAYGGLIGNHVRTGGSAEQQTAFKERLRAAEAAVQRQLAEREAAVETLAATRAARTFQARTATNTAATASATDTNPGQGQRTITPNQRPVLPPVPQATRIGNIFLMPQCRN